MQTFAAFRQWAGRQPWWLQSIAWMIAASLAVLLAMPVLAIWLFSRNGSPWLNRALPALLLLFWGLAVVPSIAPLGDRRDSPEVEPNSFANTQSERSSATRTSGAITTPKPPTSNAPTPTTSTPSTTGASTTTTESTTSTTTLALTTTTTTQAPTTSAAPASSDLAVTQTHCDAAGNDNNNENDEYIVVANRGDAAQAMTGWTLHDEGPNWIYPFPSGFSLASGASVTVFTGSGTNSSTQLFWGYGRAVWNNDGDTAHLRDASGNLVSERRC